MKKVITFYLLIFLCFFTSPSFAQNPEYHLIMKIPKEQLTLPGKILIDNKDRLYVLNDRDILIYDTGGHLIKKWEINQSANDLDVSQEGFFYIATKSNSVMKFDANGNFILQWGKYGNGDGQFDWASGIAIDQEGNVYVTDRYNHRVQKFDSNGNFIKKFGEKGFGNGQFTEPKDIDVDASGNIYVASQGIIQKFNNNGDWIAKWFSPFSNTPALTTDKDGNVYVAAVDGVSGSIRKYSPNGDILLEWGNIRPQGIAVDSLGFIYVSDNPLGQTATPIIRKFDASGKDILKWGSFGDGEGWFHRPLGIGIDENSNFIYVADSRNCLVQRFVIAGAFLEQWGQECDPEDQFVPVGPGLFAFPEDIAVDKEGFVYVVDYKARVIQKFNVQGDYVLTWEDLVGPRGIAVDKTGNVYVSDTKGNSIKKFDSSGNLLGKWDRESPTGIVVDESDNVYVISNGVKILKLDSMGIANEFWKVPKSQSAYINGISIDKSGFVYATLESSNAFGSGYVAVIDPKGQEIAPHFFDLKNEHIALLRPQGIKVAGDGSIYITEISNHQVLIFGKQFRRGDANDDGKVDISDAVFILNHLFLGGPAPSCLDAADFNDQDKNTVNLSDAIYLLSHLFRGGPELPAPYPEKGVDLTLNDGITCENYTSP